MPAVLSIEKIKRKKGFYLLRMENGPAFPVDDELVLKYGLRQGTQLSPTLLAELREKAEFQYLKQKAIDLLARRRHSEKELFSKLKYTPIYGRHAEEVIKKLKELGYIDDTAFASALIHSTLIGGAKGKMLIRRRLRRKGVPSPVVDKAMAAELADYDELKAAADLARKKMKSLKEIPRLKAKQRLAMFLSGRGFDWDTINAALRAVFEEKE